MEPAYALLESFVLSPTVPPCLVLGSCFRISGSGYFVLAEAPVGADCFAGLWQPRVFVSSLCRGYFPIRFRRGRDCGFKVDSFFLSVARLRFLLLPLPWSPYFLLLVF